MKRKTNLISFLFVLCFTYLFVSCSDDEIAAHITANPETEFYFSKGMDFNSDTESKNLIFTTSKDWKITTSETRNGTEWIQINPTSGTAGEANVSIRATENTGYEDRSVAITITSGGISKTVMVNQKQKNALLLTSNRYEVKQNGETISVEVKSNVDYKVVIPEPHQNWIKQTPVSTRSLETNILSFQILANQENEKREGEIIITDGTLQETVKVYQAGGSIILLNNNLCVVGDKGETLAVDIRSNCEFGVKMPDVDWIKEAIISKGMSSHTLYYTIQTNKNTDARSAQIIFYDKKNKSKADTLTIKQAQKDAIIISEKMYKLDTNNEKTISVDVNTNVEVEVIIPDTCKWIKESVVTRGLVLRKIYLKADKNDSFIPRQGNILIKSKGSVLCDTVKIWQPGKQTKVALAQTALTGSKNGGEYRIKIDANVAVSFNKWPMPGDTISTPDEPDVDEWDPQLFKYINIGDISLDYSISPDNYLVINIHPTAYGKINPQTITIYGEHENKSAEIVVNQEPDTNNPVELRLGNIGSSYLTSSFSKARTALSSMFTIENFYTQCYPATESDRNNWWYEYYTHDVNSYSPNLNSMFSDSYKAIRTFKLFQDKYPQDPSSAYRLLPEDSIAVKALTDMQMFMIYYEMEMLWGNTPYVHHYNWEEDGYFTQMNPIQLFELYKEPLKICISYLKDKKINSELSVDNKFFPSRDLPLLLLARIYMTEGEYLKAKDILVKTVASNKYQVKDIIYVFDNTEPSSSPEIIESCVYPYAEVLLNLAECEYKLGNKSKAEAYLSIVANVNNGNSFISELTAAWKNQLKGTGTYFAFLKRNNLAESTLNIPAYKTLLPFPGSEDLIQNPGY